MLHCIENTVQTLVYPYMERVLWAGNKAIWKSLEGWGVLLQFGPRQFLEDARDVVSAELCQAPPLSNLK